MVSASRGVYLRRRIAVGATATVLLAGAIYTPMTLLAPVPTVAAELVPLSAPDAVAAAVVMPGFGVSGVTALGESGTLAAVDDGAAHPIASITKAITAMVVLDARPMDPASDGETITFTDQDAAFYDEQIAGGGSAEPVTPGVSMSQRDVLELMLLPSANNVAQTLATWAFGSEAAYVEAARAWLAEQGMVGTTIVDASGYDDANASTVGDLLTLGSLVALDSVLAPIVALTSAEVPDTGIVENSNHLLGTAGVDGIKTGTSPLAGACLLFSADAVVGSQTVTIIGVVLGGPDHATVREAAAAMVGSTAGGFREIEVIADATPVAEFDQVWGDAAAAVTADPVSILVWSDTPVSIDVAVESVSLADAGTDVGTLTVTTGPRTATTEVELDASIEDPGPWWRLTNPGVL